ncbi:hypothetical protein [Bradyrhizobium sp. CCGUVB23]|uniref:hypothetical protein n=1 Tax=Bradyrhizobium sp. CCGUVB23 TaxID=2949630 RepID=UPI0020B2F639|nr:hypothetical protein [Bradyrhizobium sp. CCGUVB23]MCP3464621.1 hypothetical protein [Bradyrhizobium sp. CCGUVB23]
MSVFELMRSAGCLNRSHWEQGLAAPPHDKCQMFATLQTYLIGATIAPQEFPNRKRKVRR